MTQEEKAKRYDEVIRKAKITLDCCGSTSIVTQHTIYDIFPELKESEGEKIRKELITHCRNTRCVTEEGAERIAKWIAWLEKQGEEGKINHEEICKSYGISDIGEFSDGYHTFNELYYYRMLYNAAFFNMLPKEWVHKSKKHHDGEECFGGGWFIVMVNLPTGQVSNHYELKYWDLFQIPEKETADEWDGHTPQEAADRLHKYLLEMQGEQKPILDFNADDWYVSDVDGKIHSIYHSADKVEPKFHEGDWVIDKQGIVHQIANVVENATNNIYGYDIVGDSHAHRIGVLSRGYFNDNNEGVRLWTIEDARDGDVLACNEEILLFKSYSVQGRISVYCWYNGQTNNFHSKEVDDALMTTRNKICPATKEQRDMLFQKMKEAGYEWDEIKNKLKKVEDEPENFKRQVMSEMCDLVNDYIQQKPAEWSEEDELILKQAIYVCHQNGYTAVENWLKSLKDRVQLQPKQEWSEEDGYIIEEIEAIIDAYVLEENDPKALKNWLKSLKDRYTWKPSDEQIESFEHFVRSIGESGYASPYSNNTKLLYSLLEQLKKLKGE